MTVGMGYRDLLVILSGADPNTTDHEPPGSAAERCRRRLAIV